MVNIDLLRHEMHTRNITIDQAAGAINIDPSTFYRRIAKKGENFTVGEVVKLAKLLEMDSKTLERVFFDRKLAGTQDRSA